jgi:N4-gp56 family major capsid protein
MDGSDFTCTLEIVGADTKNVWLSSAPPAALANGDKLFPGEGGNPSNGNQAAVYSTLFLGKDAYGMIDPAGGSLEMIVKDKKQIGGPLEQYSTAGYKFEHGSVVLYQERMLRVESCSSYSMMDEAN